MLIWAASQSDSVTEVIVMNEQGAHYFDEYQDSSGNHLVGKEIGCWDEVSAEEATFSSSAQRIAFTVHAVPGARLFRGRELVGSRLAWAGFGYSFPPSVRRLRYDADVTSSLELRAADLSVLHPAARPLGLSLSRRWVSLTSRPACGRPGTMCTCSTAPFSSARLPCCAGACGRGRSGRHLLHGEHAG